MAALRAMRLSRAMWPSGAAPLGDIFQPKDRAVDVILTKVWVARGGGDGVAFGV